MEAGELLVLRSCPDLLTNSGLAGGILPRTASARARAEAVERDAFFHHYRTGTPFSSSNGLPERIEPEKERGQILRFSLASADSALHVALVTDEGCEVWNGEQLQTVDQNAIAQLLGISPERVPAGLRSRSPLEDVMHPRFRNPPGVGSRS